MTGPSARNRLTADELRARIGTLWSQGLCVSQIAERLGYTRFHIGKVAGDLGLTTRRQHRTRYDGIATTGRVFPRGRSAGAVMV